MAREKFEVPGDVRQSPERIAVHVTPVHSEEVKESLDLS